MRPVEIRDATSFRTPASERIPRGCASSAEYWQLPIANCQLRLPAILAFCENSQVNAEELKARTKEFALRILNLAEKLPHGVKGRVLSDQIARAGTSVAANYRAACKARSRAEFIAKIGVAEEEADEVQFWLEMISEVELIPAPRLTELQQEARELTAILAASRKSAVRHK